MDNILNQFINEGCSISKNTHIKLKIRAGFNKTIKNKIYEWFIHIDGINPLRVIETIDVVIRSGKSDCKTELNNVSCDNVKTLVFYKGIQDKSKKYYCRKQGMDFTKFQSIDKQISWKMVKYKEEIIPNKKYITTDASNKIVIKNKLIFTIKDIELVYFHLTLFKKIDKNNTTHINHLEYIKRNMLPSKTTPYTFAHIKTWSVCDDAIIELFMDKDLILYDQIRLKLSKNDIFNKLKKNINASIKLIEKYFYINNQNINYTNILLQVAKKIAPNFIKNYLSGKWGLRQMTYNVISLDMVDIYDNILKNKADYFISPKIDGERCIVYYDTQENDNALYLITHELCKITMINEKNSNVQIIADAEMVKTETAVYIHIFDIMYYNPGYISRGFSKPYNSDHNYNSNHRDRIQYDHLISNSNHRDRIQYDHLISNSNHRDRIQYGHLILNSNNKTLNDTINKSYATRITSIPVVVRELNALFAFSKNTNTMKQDMIFVEKKIIDLSYIDEKKNYNFFINKDECSLQTPLDGLILTKKISDSYIKTESWKWKPKKIATIDFLIKKNPTFNKNDTTSKQYLLKVGDLKYGKYMSINFSPHDYPLIYNHHNIDFETTHCENPDGKIGEFQWTGRKWKLLRMRNDRQNEVKKGNYFGNDIRTAETIWQGIKNYVDIDILYVKKAQNFGVSSVYMADVFTKYIKNKKKNIMLFVNNMIFDKLDIYTITQHLVKNTKLFAFTNYYTETWIIKNIYNNKNIVKNYVLYYNSIYICSSVKKIIKRGIKNIKDNLLSKGINIPNRNVELAIIVCENLNIDSIKLPKLVGFINTFLQKFGKVIFLINNNETNDNCQLNAENIINTMNNSKGIKYEIELYTPSLISFMSFPANH